MALREFEYQALEDIVGPENITQEPEILDTYNQCWGHKLVFDQKWSTRPAAVLLPRSTEELQAIVKVCNRYHITFKPFSSGFEIVAFALPNERGILLDLKRMDRILEIDEKNMHAVVEPYVSVYKLQKELAKLGLFMGPIGAGPSAGVIAASCCHFGAGLTMISTGGLGRNVLGVEWVLPSGEVLKMGTSGIGAGWFAADGPGPSLRGVLRGRSGANGGHGIISKASVKVYPWYGPPEVEFTAEPGLPTSAKAISEVPNGYKVLALKFPDRDVTWEALVRIGRAEIATALTRAMMFPYGEGNDEMYEAMLQVEKEGMPHYIDLAMEALVVILGAETPRGLEYREKCLMEICAQLGGVSIPMPPEGERKAFGSLMYHFGFVQTAFRRSGDFFVSPTCDATIDMIKNMRKVAVDVIKPYMDKGLVMQTKEPEPFMVPTEHNSNGCHVESVYFYDPWDDDSLKGVREIIEKVEDPEGPLAPFGVPHLGGGLQIEWFSHTHQKWGPVYDNYDVWHRKIKEALDPNNIGDWSAYIPPVFP